MGETRPLPEVRVPNGRVRGVHGVRQESSKASEASNVRRRLFTVAVFLLAGAVASPVPLSQYRLSNLSVSETAMTRGSEAG